MQKKTSKKQSAFTLIETLIAMLVLAIGLLGLAGITIVVLRSNTLSQQVSEATNIASTLMEDLKRQPISAMNDCTPYAYNAIYTPTCSMLAESGLAAPALAGNFYPAQDLAQCPVNGIIGSSAQWVTFDMITPDLNPLNSVTFPAISDMCTAFANVNIPPRNYVRFYRVYGTTDKTINVAVLWKDKFGKWRNIHFSTVRSSGS